jgi:hypothetical protein
MNNEKLIAFANRHFRNVKLMAFANRIGAIRFEVDLHQKHVEFEFYKGQGMGNGKNIIYISFEELISSYIEDIDVDYFKYLPGFYKKWYDDCYFELKLIPDTDILQL